MNRTTAILLVAAILFSMPMQAMAKRKAVKTTTVGKTFQPILNFQKMLTKGKASLSDEVKLGVKARARKSGKGTALTGKARTIRKVRPVAKRGIAAKFLTVNRQSYFKKAVNLKARKGLFRGTKHLNVKKMTLSPQVMKPLRVNPALLKIARRATIPKPDIRISRVEWVGDHGKAKRLAYVSKSSKGKWMRFRINLKNDGDAPAYRIDVTAEHLGREWPSEVFHKVKMNPKAGTHVFEIKVLIPPNATANRTHSIEFYADKQKVNNDSNWSNNRVVKSFKLTPPTEPDLFLKQFKRVKVGSQKDWGPFKRGYIRYKYDVEIGNRGQKSAPPTNVSFLVQKVDHRKKKKEPSLYRSWSYQVPKLFVAKSHKFRTGDWKVYADQSCRVDCAVDPKNLIAEPNLGNNTGAHEFTVKVKNPFKGTFLAAAWRAGYKASIKIGDAIYDGAVWVYKKVKAASQYALAAIITPEMIAWVEVSKQIHEPKCRRLNATEKALLKPMFPQSLINNARVLTLKSYQRPEFWGDGIAVTFKNVIVFQKGKYSQKTLVHEMVHSYQYKKLGLAKFCWEYIYTWVKTGFSYRSISLEKQAYGFDALWSKGQAGDIKDYLGY